MAKKVSFDLSPPTKITLSHPPVVDQADRVRFKTQSLLQDYVDLVKDTQDKKIRLRRAKKKKLNLTAEVIFLRQKYQYFIKNHPERFSLLNPQTSYAGVKKSSKAKNHQSQRKPPSSSVVCPTTSPNSDQNAEFHRKEKDYSSSSTKHFRGHSIFIKAKALSLTAKNEAHYVKLSKAVL